MGNHLHQVWETNPQQASKLQQFLDFTININLPTRDVSLFLDLGNTPFNGGTHEQKGRISPARDERDYPKPTLTDSLTHNSHSLCPFAPSCRAEAWRRRIVLARPPHTRTPLLEHEPHRPEFLDRANQPAIIPPTFANESVWSMRQGVSRRRNSVRS